MKNDTTSPIPPPARRPLHIGGRLWKCLIGLILIGVSSIFVQYLWNTYTRAVEMDSWIEVPCRIETMEVDDSELNQRGMPKYIFKVTYTYEFEGKPYTGNRLKLLSTEVSDPRKLKSSIEAYRAGTTSICHVNPAAPEMAVLKKNSKAALYSIWFPFIFIIGGGGIIVSALFKKSP